MQIETDTLPPGLHVRPLERCDREALGELFNGLTPESRRRRFLSPKPDVTPRELNYLSDVDHVGHEAIAAFDRRGRMVAVARYATGPGLQAAGATADVAATVSDDWQGRGLGTALMRLVVKRARENAIAQLHGETFWENAAARSLLDRLGFHPRGSSNGVIELHLPLAA
jgi:GNAT superfamily N-acetyltransferase